MEKMDVQLNDVEVNLALRFPLILASFEKNVVIYAGSIDVQGETYKVTIREAVGENFTISNLSKSLQNAEEALHYKIKQTSPLNIITVLDILVSYISENIHSTRPVNRCEMYRYVLHEYSEFTRFYLNLKTTRLANDLSEINVSIVDDGHREHFLKLKVDYSSGQCIFRVEGFDLPQESGSFKPSSSLRILYEQFIGLVETFQPFFNLMDMFDTNCWVLDPVPSKRQHKYRRISLGENISLIITVDPFKPSQLPEIKFLGPERLVESFRSTINVKLEEWESRNDTFSEILSVLGIENFPIKPNHTTNTEDLLWQTGDCSICFSSKLNEKLPEVACQNQCCANCYHVECLYEWLMSVNARRIFTEVVGACPNCEKPISCPIPN